MNGCSFSLYRFLFDRSERSCLNKCGYSSHNSLFFRSPILVLSIPAVPLQKVGIFVVEPESVVPYVPTTRAYVPCEVTRQFVHIQGESCKSNLSSSFPATTSLSSSFSTTILPSSSYWPWFIWSRTSFSSPRGGSYLPIYRSRCRTPRWLPSRSKSSPQHIP